MPERMRRVPVEKTHQNRTNLDGPQQTEITCKCPILDPEEWNAIESDWNDIRFLRGAAFAIFGVPLRFGATRNALIKTAKKLSGKLPEDAMILIGSGRFRREILIELDNHKKIPDNKRIFEPGGFSFTRIYEAPWGQMRNLMTGFENQATTRYGRKPDQTWVWYLTCQICTTARNFETLFVAHYRNGKT